MKIKDERVIQLNNKIQKEAYLLVLFLAVASICIKSYVMEMPVKQYMTELAIIILSTLYIAVRSMFLGYEFMNDTKSSKILTVLAILVLSLAVSIINGIKNYSLYGNKYTGILDGHFIAVLVVTFISSVIFITATFALLYGVNKAGQRRLEKKLNEEDE